VTRVAIVGCGLIGAKRARALTEARLVVACDVDRGRAERLAAEHASCRAVVDPREAVAADDVDVVIVATINDALAETTQLALSAGKHVLVEKPAARPNDDLLALITLARTAKRVVKVGFNHRFHPGAQKMRAIVDAGELGELMFLRARYGHGGRLGYEREWRADPQRAGGGELLDQGVHLIDLARWFLGDVAEVSGHVGTFFWDMPVEDNAFLVLRTREERVALLHASCSEWKNMFSLELYGRDGKLQLDGLGGSYGVEKLTHYRMLPQMGPPETETWEYPGEDVSWREEWRHFLGCIEGREQPLGDLGDAHAALEVVRRAYALPGRRSRPIDRRKPPSPEGHS